MSQAGREILARWRESGEWWSGETPKEFVRFIDAKGVRREVAIEVDDAPVRPTNDKRPTTSDEDLREEIVLRLAKTRDEKVAKACGFAREATSLYRLPSPDSRFPASYVPLHAVSGYAFGRGTMLADEVARLAAVHELPAAVLADPHSLVGAVEFSRAARGAGVKPLIGATVELPEGGELVLIARTPRGYRNLSRLVTECHLGEPRLFPLGSWERLEGCAEDLLCLTGGDLGPINRLLAQRRDAEASRLLDRLVATYGRENVVVEIERSFVPWELSVNTRLLQMAEAKRLLAAAGGIATHSRPEDFPVQDIIVCAESLCVVDEVVGRKPRRAPGQRECPRAPDRALNAERFLKSAHEMAELFADRPDLLANTLRVAERCEDDVLPPRTRLPQLYDDDAHALREITLAGAHRRHPRIDPKLKKRIHHELERIVRLGFAGHFLTIWDACNWARQQGILFSARGSVVDAAVAYCLGLSRIDAHAHKLHFDRFLPADGSKRPDIDIDFEAKHRDAVRDYLTRKYGEDRVATVCAVGAYCTRGIVREVGKALGLSSETIGFLAKRLHGGISPAKLEAALDARPELRGSAVPRERFRWVFELAERLTDIPRNMRAHSSGVVISDRPMHETVPVMASGAFEPGEGSQPIRIIQWDKRSAKHFFDKFDLLCLRGQDVLAGAQERIRVSDADFHVEQIPLDDPETYRAMRSGELIGIPQSASPAMRQAHIRLRTENLHDASLVQAGIRPGVGGAVKINELIMRRRGLQAYSFAHPELERIMGLTYGIVVFQEQVDQLLQTFCGYTSGEAEDIRDGIHKRRREAYAKAKRDEIVARIMDQGHGMQLASEVYDLIAGFEGYGFAQGHALAFAEISIRSIHCQQNFPAEYFASILSAQPAGYYGPCTLANEARCRGVAVLLPDVNRSKVEFTVEAVRSAMDPQIVLPSGGVRTGLMQVMGLSKETRARILDARFDGPYRSVFDFAARVRPERDELERLILCGALDALHANRRAMLWAVPSALRHAHAVHQGRGADVLPFEIPEPPFEDSLDDFSKAEKAVYERMFLDLDASAHLMAFERERVSAKGGITAAEARALPHRRKAVVVGHAIRLRFPPTKSGKRVVFFDLEDETGLLNVTCFDDVYQRDGHAIVCSGYVTLIGEAQDRDGHTAFLAHRVFPYRPTLAGRVSQALPVVTADFLVG
ncbi:MAG: DNA polymerase III subunit alpha [Fimbriimonadaceae bacterium]|nr:DNA polymerase III subunit alpha [Chthonomonadaceae bacterium]MCO5295862.1 DNA polymerase III subunit alpha [Fimbriimonadaceae bacterium]